MEWKRFSEEKPPVGVSCIVSRKCEDCYGSDRRELVIAYFVEGVWYEKDPDEAKLFECEGEVVYWMLLPGLPKEEEAVSNKPIKKPRRPKDCDDD